MPYLMFFSFRYVYYLVFSVFFLLKLKFDFSYVIYILYMFFYILNYMIYFIYVIFDYSYIYIYMYFFINIYYFILKYVGIFVEYILWLMKIYYFVKLSFDDFLYYVTHEFDSYFLLEGFFSVYTRLIYWFYICYYYYMDWYYSLIRLSKFDLNQISNINDTNSSRDIGFEIFIIEKNQNIVMCYIMMLLHLFYRVLILLKFFLVILG